MCATAEGGRSNVGRVNTAHARHNWILAIEMRFGTRARRTHTHTQDARQARVRARAHKRYTRDLC
jgi:hypothetical protein